MNAHTRKSKLKSVLHYRDQIQQMREAIDINQHTISLLTIDFKECCPFQKGDIFFHNKTIYKFDLIQEAVVSNEGNLSFKVWVYLPLDKGWRQNTTMHMIEFDDIDNIKMLHKQNADNS